jgi:hypothetical protein
MKKTDAAGIFFVLTNNLLSCSFPEDYVCFYIINGVFAGYTAGQSEYNLRYTRNGAV